MRILDRYLLNGFFHALLYCLALFFVLFIVIWGFFSHNVLEERYILLAVGLLASMVATYRIPRSVSVPNATIPANQQLAVPSA